MAEVLLVHGSCHGAWCWDLLVPHLSALGHSVRTIDLPSHGADTTPPDTVTLDSYAAAIADAIDTQAVVIGHSMAGYPITAAAERAPHKIAKLIYLCAYVPQNGRALVDLRRESGSTLPAAVSVDATRTTFRFRPEAAKAALYHDVSDDRIAWALERLTPQPILPQETPLTIDRSAGIARRYVICDQDQAIPAEYQRVMTADWPRDHVVTLNTSHSPFLSVPGDLAAVLDTLIRT